MVLICHDCQGKWPGEAKVWLYPCEECAMAFVEAHKALGHHIRARDQTYGDRYLYGSL